MNILLLKAMVRCTQEHDGYDSFPILHSKILKTSSKRLLLQVACVFCSSMTWSMYLFLRSHLLLVYWHLSWTPHCIERTVRPGKTEACLGGIDSDHIRQIQEVRNSIPCLSTSTSSSLQCDFHWGWLRVTESSAPAVSHCLYRTSFVNWYCQWIKPFCWVFWFNHTW